MLSIQEDGTIPLFEYSALKVRIFVKESICRFWSRFQMNNHISFLSINKRCIYGQNRYLYVRNFLNGMCKLLINFTIEFRVWQNYFYKI